MSLAFRTLIDELAAAGIRLGVDQHIAIERLLMRYDGDDPRELRDALAALLGKDREQVERISRLFDHVQDPPPPPPPPRDRTRFVLAITVAVGAAIVVAAWLARPLPHLDVTAIVAPQIPCPACPPPPPRPCVAPAPELPSATRQEPLPPWIGIAIGVVGCAGLVLVMWRRRQAWRRGVRRAQLDRLAGPRLPSEPTADAWSHEFLDKLASALRAPSDTRELDVRRTVERTVRMGLVPHLVYARRRRTLGVRIAIADGPEMEPFVGIVDELVAGLARRTVSLERIPYGTQLRDDAALLVVTAQRIAPWWQPTARVAVIDPFGRLPGAFALDEDDLVAAADYLAGGDARPVRRMPLRWDDVLQLRAMVALAQRRSFAIAERLRTRFLPNAPRAILGAIDSDLPDRKRAARYLGDAKAREVHRALLDIFAALEPVRGSAAHVRWRGERLDHLAAVSPDEAERERSDLAAWASSDVGDVPGPRWFPGLLFAAAPLAVAGAALVAPVVAVPQERVWKPDVFVFTAQPTFTLRRTDSDPTGVVLAEVFDNGAPIGSIGDLDADGKFELEPGSQLEAIATKRTRLPVGHCLQAWRVASDVLVEGSNAVLVGTKEGPNAIAPSLPRIVPSVGTPRSDAKPIPTAACVHRAGSSDDWERTSVAYERIRSTCFASASECDLSAQIPNVKCTQGAPAFFCFWVYNEANGSQQPEACSTREEICQRARADYAATLAIGRIGVSDRCYPVTKKK